MKCLNCGSLDIIIDKDEETKKETLCYEHAWSTIDADNLASCVMESSFNGRGGCQITHNKLISA